MLTAGRTFIKFGAIPLYKPRNPSSLTICLASGINPAPPATVTEKLEETCVEYWRRTTYRYVGMLFITKFLQGYDSECISVVQITWSNSVDIIMPMAVIYTASWENINYLTNIYCIIYKSSIPCNIGIPKLHSPNIADVERHLVCRL